MIAIRQNPIAITLIFYRTGAFMRFGSTITFGAAFLCALIAALLVRAMLVGGEGTGSAGADMESIVVAARDLKAGDKLIPSAIREVRWPADLLPKGAFTSRKDLFKEAGERTLSAAIAENEPILAHRLLNGDNG
ncbi:MAG TPA: SAF domain-containing protein, partial [Hyphomicrobiales bacterium]|nr:SAF domain-containing protein [Hyphomicrobiales bacterium]